MNSIDFGERFRIERGLSGRNRIKGGAFRFSVQLSRCGGSDMRTSLSTLADVAPKPRALT